MPSGNHSYTLPSINLRCEYTDADQYVLAFECYGRERYSVCINRDVRCVVVSNIWDLARLRKASISRAWRILPLYQRPRHSVSAPCCGHTSVCASSTNSRTHGSSCGIFIFALFNPLSRNYFHWGCHGDCGVFLVFCAPVVCLEENL